MVKIKNKNFLIGILLAVLCSCLIFVGIFQLTDREIQSAKAEINVELSEKQAESYAFGDEYTVPTCTFTKNGKSAQGIASLQFPDGTETNDEKVTLNQSGKYILRYIATIDGKVYTKEYSFTVYGRLATYASNKTSIEYGLCTDFGANSNGLMVKIANGDSLAFDHIFDMSQLSMATKLLEGFVVPTVQGSADFARMVFTFTDVEDSSVQLVYYGNFYDDSNAHGLTYFTAAGSGQVHCGLEYVGKLHVGGSLGCMVPHSFLAVDTGLYWGAKKAEPAAPDAKKFCISYDAKNNQAWAGGKIISDLDDSNYYDKLWFGFPSGKAKLTISALNYNNATANICFTEILGVDLTAENYIDEEAPLILVDTDYVEMPTALLGGNYPVPTASAIDQVNGVCDVKVSVWHNYGTKDEKMVDVQNGRFFVKDVGVYAIVYEASDYSGNVGRKVLWVRAALKASENLFVTIDPNYVTDIEVGVNYQLPNVTVTGASGNYSVSYSIEKGKNACVIENGRFSLTEAGDWTLICIVEDYVGNKAFATCTLKAYIGDKPILEEEPKFPAAFISGATYELPILYAHDYSSGKKVEKRCSVLITNNGTTKEYQSGDAFTLETETNGELFNIAYTCDGETVWEEEFALIRVFEQERIPGAAERYRDVVKMERYFHTADDLTFENDYELKGVKGLKISTNQAMDKANLAFINPQMANNFSLDFSTVPDASKFSQINIRLADSENSDITVTASLIKNDGQTTMIVGDTTLSLLLDFDGAIASAYNIGFANNQFIVNSTTSVEVSKTDGGEPFNGFTSGKVYFELEILNAEANASIFLSKVCNVNVNNKQDNTGPFIGSTGSITTNAYKDSVYTIERVIACDVLSPNVDVFLTVIAPNGEVATDVNGTLLNNVNAAVEYKINLSHYGEYYISIIAKESDSWKYKNESYFDYVLTVEDGEAPTITFSGDFATTLKVGEMLTIPRYTVSDNYTSAENITVLAMIVNPKGMPIYLYGDDRSIQCQYAGEYKVIIYVYDEMGNLTSYERSVTVK